MALVSTMTELQSAIDALVSAGYDRAAFAGVTDFAKVEAALSDAGFVKVVNDAGASLGYQRLFTQTVAQTAAATTGESTSLIAAADISADFATGTGGASLAGLSGDAVGAAVLTPKTAIVCAAAGALGLTFGFDLGQAIVGAMTDSGFDWATESVGGKILTYLTGDGTTYVSENLVNNIKDWLIDNGYFADGDFTPSVIDKSNYKSYPLLGFFPNVPDFALSAVAETIEHFNLNLNSGKVYILMGNIYGYNLRFDIFELYNNLIIDSYSSNFQTGETPKQAYIGCEISEDNYSISPSHKYSYLFGRFKDSVEGRSWFNVVNDGQCFVTANIGTVSGGTPDGVTKQSGAIYPTKNDSVTTTYPDWSTKSKTVSRPIEGNPNNKSTVLPIKLSVIDPKTGDQSSSQSDPTSDLDAKELLQTQSDIATKNKVKIPDTPTSDIGNTDPSTPVAELGGTPNSGMVALYNPTISQLSSFSQWLWSDNFIDNIKKLFQDPMDAIIGLHLIYATPSTSNIQTIVTGFLDSNVPSKVVNNQYIVIDCGTITINRYFGNVLDFNPYTKIQVYLPFIGVVTLDTDDVMNRAVTIKYKVDVLTGTCLAIIKISPTADDILRQKTLYSYAGNCAVQLPISGGSYSGIISNCIGVASSVAATVISGGALAPAAVVGAANAVTNSKLNVEHSGSLGSNAGSLGIKKPYLIITRPKPYNASSYQRFYGFPSNNTVVLGDCTGYTRVKNIILSGINATDDELSELESILKEGVIL